MIDHDKSNFEALKEKVEFAISCSKTIGGKKAEIATWAYENVLEWIMQLEENEND